MPSRKEFEDSKQKALAWVANLIGVTLQELRDNAGRAA
jgi:hypothetical protein